MRWPRRLIVLFVVGLLGLYPLLAPPPHRIDKAHCDLIKEGMTKDEVESIFGAPPGEYDFAEQKAFRYQGLIRFAAVRRIHTTLDLSSVQVQPLTVNHYVRIWPSDWSTWTGRHGAFTVSFDEEGRVISKRGPAEVIIVPPWQRWWKKLTE
jgi:hypothetical protein